MTGKEALLSNIHKDFRKDPYIQEILNSSGIEIDNLKDTLNDLYHQFNFATMTWGANLLADAMGIKFDSTLTQEEKNSVVAARWKSDSKCDLNLIQMVCNAWKNGNVVVSFIGGRINLKFVSEFGTPTNLEDLKKQINLSKPAHLMIDYAFRYLLIKDIHEVLTINQMQALTLDKFAGKGIV